MAKQPTVMLAALIRLSCRAIWKSMPNHHNSAVCRIEYPKNITKQLMLTKRCRDGVWDVGFDVMGFQFDGKLDAFDRYASEDGRAADVKYLVVIVLLAVMDKAAVIYVAKDGHDLGFDLPVRWYDNFGPGKKLKNVDGNGVLNVGLDEVDVRPAEDVHDFAP